MTLIAKIEPYWKAVVAFVTPAIPTVLASMQESSAGGTTIVAVEWVTIIAASLGTSAVVYATPNKDRTGTKQDESVQPPEDGLDGSYGIVRH